ncbi:Hsp20/alpha crystallin family protein [Uliginosibacterium sp. sgz301328]|uniref:Hsp20/alpha crystallin family protein n=1 Tax=Uliginosibacterium sp. sgz301328 TaxID=3243764 RepID=UPI00359D3C8F
MSMNLINTDPFDDFFRGFFVRPVEFEGDHQRIASIRVDVKENADSYLVQAELPGIAKDDIQVQIDGGLLTISAERKQEKQVKEGERVLRTERHYGKVARSFQLGQEVDEGQASARFTDGVLELTLPKKAAPQAKRLTIQ